MLDKKSFDLWANGYDKTVEISDEENAYPFAGYKDVLGIIFETIMEKPNATVLDIGFGTGTLTTKLYEHGCSIYGQDFSSRMIELASKKMPGSHLYQGDFTKGLAEPLRNQCYDFIVATYSLHHLGAGFLQGRLCRVRCETEICLYRRKVRGRIAKAYDGLLSDGGRSQCRGDRGMRQAGQSAMRLDRAHGDGMGRMRNSACSRIRIVRGEKRCIDSEG